ncbi:MAG: hypothetical protein LLG00_16740 [Planctomycetaceae bacterium]|nr:hypothetical protein [Planctomycetaceae bacterium]
MKVYGDGFVTGEALAKHMAGIDATSAERKMAERFTAIRACAVEDAPDAHTAWLKVEQQSFCVTPAYCDTAEEAAWVCLMLAKALLKVGAVAS